jgi:hypothetical protein
MAVYAWAAEVPDAKRSRAKRTKRMRGRRVTDEFIQEKASTQKGVDRLLEHFGNTFACGDALCSAFP